MTTNTNALALRVAPQHTMDIEAQKPEAPQYNRTLARAKIATLAAASIAGALTTAIVALHEGSDTSGLQSRSLLNEEGCSPHQLKNIASAKRALVISGATTGACLGGVILGACMWGGGSVAEEEEGAVRAAGMASMGVGGLMASLGSLGFTLGTTATLISGIIYGVSKNNC